MLVPRLTVSVAFVFLVLSSPLMAADLVTSKAPTASAKPWTAWRPCWPRTASALWRALIMPPMPSVSAWNWRLPNCCCSAILQRHVVDAGRGVVGIDLPMKALAWEDADGVIWLAYVVPSSIAVNAVSLAHRTPWPQWMPASTNLAMRQSLPEQPFLSWMHQQGCVKRSLVQVPG